MGYITCYRLSVLTAEGDQEDKIFDELRLQDEDIDYVLEDGCIKWYNH